MGFMGLESGISALQFNSGLMDRIANRLAFTADIPVPETSSGFFTSSSSLLIVKEGENTPRFSLGTTSPGGATSDSVTLGLLPDDVVSSLNVDIAAELVNLLTAKSAFEANIRVVNEANHTLKVLTRLGE
jgi:flagellar basal body rod protein FlgG